MVSHPFVVNHQTSARRGVGKPLDAKKPDHEHGLQRPAIEAYLELAGYGVVMTALKKGLTLLLCGALIVGCEKQHSIEPTASATAEASEDGSISVRSSTPQEVARLQNDIAKREAVDARYPGMTAPKGAPSQRVTNIVVPGILTLDDGRTVKLDGVRCDSQAVGYLRRVLMRDGDSVVVIPTAESTGEPIPANVWSMAMIKLDGSVPSPSYSNPIETAITSGWCKVEATPTCKYNERYAALAEAFQAAAASR
jgi:hypothetical protein